MSKLKPALVFVVALTLFVWFWLELISLYGATDSAALGLLKRCFSLHRRAVGRSLHTISAQSFIKPVKFWMSAFCRLADMLSVGIDVR